MPGSWFNNLTPSERTQKYTAEAYDYKDVHTFEKKGSRPRQTCPGIKFLCEADVFEDPKHVGFIMPLVEWNRFRHETYKDNRPEELKYIRSPSAAAATAPAAPDAPERPLIYSEFTLGQSGAHEQRPRGGGPPKKVPYETWTCNNSSGNCKHRKPFKVVARRPASSSPI